MLSPRHIPTRLVASSSRPPIGDWRRRDAVPAAGGRGLRAAPPLRRRSGGRSPDRYTPDARVAGARLRQVSSSSAACGSRSGSCCRSGSISSRSRSARSWRSCSTARWILRVDRAARSWRPILALDRAPFDRVRRRPVCRGLDRSGASRAPATGGRRGGRQSAETGRRPAVRAATLPSFASSWGCCASCGSGLTCGGTGGSTSSRP